MRIVRFQRPGYDLIEVGLLEGDLIYPIDAITDPIDFLVLATDEQDSLAAEARSGQPLSAGSVALRRPLGYMRRVLALASNYRKPGGDRHGGDATPWFFMKWADGTLGPNEAIPLPSLADLCVQEIELAVVIGRRGRNIAERDALEYVAGYSVCNDVSARTLTIPASRRAGDYTSYLDWLNGKWFDGFFTLGPAVVRAQDLDASNLRITATINGATCLDGTTADMHFDVAQSIAYISKFMELQPGDVIATGMPQVEGDEVRLEPGDVIDGTIEGIGTLSNPVITGV